MPDEQDSAELFDEDTVGDDGRSLEPTPDDGRVHGHLLAPDEGGPDEVSELVATEIPTDGQLAPEEAALHLEDH